MMNVKGALLLAATGVASIALATPAFARTESGTSSGGVKWTAESRIVAVDSTATAAGGGNPIHFGTADKYRGTVGLLMQYANGDAFVCSGSLMSDRVSILTAGHCVSDGAKPAAGLTKVTAYFYDGNPADVPVYTPGAPGVKTVDVSKIFVNSQYTGEVIDQNDMAVLRLGAAAPSFANGYGLYTGNLTGQEFNVAGYGRRSDVGGDLGADLGTGRLRQGDNQYDYAWGDSRFGGLFVNPDPACGGGTNWFCGNAKIDQSFVSDFDNGLLRNDTGCLVAVFIGGASPLGNYCQGQGLGANEVSIAPGDSGGPAFIDGKVASVNSYGLSFGSFYGDVDDKLNSSFGEFNGFATVSANYGFITSALAAPEPATWGMMILGFGMIGGALRSRRKTNVRFAA